MKRHKKNPIKSSHRGQQANPVAQLIGFRLVKTGRGTATCEMRVHLSHLNPVGRAHGGILCDLADAAMGYAFLQHLPPSKKGVTTNFQISFLKAVRVGHYLRAHAKTIAHGRSLYFMECEVANGAGQLVAKATSTCKVLKKK